MLFQLFVVLSLTLSSWASPLLKRGADISASLNVIYEATGSQAVDCAVCVSEPLRTLELYRSSRSLEPLLIANSVIFSPQYFTGG